MKKKHWIILAIIFALAINYLHGGLASQAMEQKTLRVGSVTAMTGKFFTNMWGMNASDIDVRKLLHSYPTVDLSVDQISVVNPVAVQDMQVSLDTRGNRIHTITLHEDLYFSDGTPINAQDYIFSILLQYSPYIRDLGGVPIKADFLYGGSEYQNKKTDKLLGVRLLDDYVFSIAVTRNSYPYYYDLAYINFNPYPIHVIAPGCAVKDSAQGVYIEGPFNLETLKETILNPQTGYLSHPSVVSGAYQLIDYDQNAKKATFITNPFYKGNINNIKPTIERLEFKTLGNEDILTAFENNKIDLVNKVSDCQVRNEAKNISYISSNTYERNGLAFIAFLTEQEAVNDVKLRKAIAHLIDKEKLVKNFLCEYGKPVDAYYGIGQWMAKQAFIDKPVWNIYHYDIEAAAELIKKAGYYYDKDGRAYIEGSGTLRYRKSINGELKPLILRMAITQNHQVAELLIAQMEKDFAQVGIELIVDRITLPELLQVYYAQSERKYDMLFLASNFYELFDPYYIFHTAPEYRGRLNATFINDKTLMLAAKKMRETPSDKQDIYYKNWVAFQQAFTKTLPMIPLYSNTYSDLYTERLKEYNIQNYNSFADAIIEANLD